MQQDESSVAFAIAIVNGRPMVHGDCLGASAAAIESLAAFDQRLLEVDLSGVTFFNSFESSRCMGCYAPHENPSEL